MDNKNLWVNAECYVRYTAARPELVSTDGQKTIELGASEYKILVYFIEHRNKPVTLKNLALMLWGENWETENNEESLKPHISKLRTKFDGIRQGLRACLATNHGFGTYTLNVDDAPIEPSLPYRSDMQRPEKGDQVRTAQYSDLIRIGYTPVSIAEALVENDKRLYRSVFQDKGITDENEGTPKQWAEYLSSVPETFQYLINREGKIVGNFSFVSITHEQEKLYLQGQLYECAFSPDNTRDLFSSGKDHILFLLNLSVNDDYSTPRNNTMLRKLFLDELASLAENDIYFTKIITNVYKSSHEAFYKTWGFSFVKEHPLSGRIYELSMTPYPQKLSSQLRQNSKLIEVNERLKRYYGKHNA